MSEDDLSDKALAEAGKTAREYRPEVRAVGAFFYRVLGRPLEGAGDVVGDGFNAVRIEYLFRLRARFDRKMKERGMDGPTRAAKLNVAYPLFEAASVEDDEDIQEMFAELLVNAVDADSEIDVQKSFVEIVGSMSSVEAKILVALADSGVAEGGFIGTSGLPNAIVPGSSDPPEHIKLALSNLIRNGCVFAPSDGLQGPNLGLVALTPLGGAIVRACRRPPKSAA